ncbi:MAG: protein tyrosine phosphatase family protein [Pseudohongiella sp.]|nr:protein tyrosine phosphatase family protein [Pseudohongiella sp.]
MIYRAILASLIVFTSLSAQAQIQEPANPALNEIFNFRQYSDTFASAGQPTAEQFSAVRDAGFERVIYLAFTNNPNAVANADQLVKSLGMDYVHIPVDWTRPTSLDFYTFADAMRRDTDRKTLLHCQVNARATAFSFLYRVIYEDVPVSQAKADMNSVWQPNETWRDFIFAVMAENNVDPQCEGCDWTPSTAGN